MTATFVPDLWSELIDSLRSELEGFGELMRLIEGQREQILRRDADGLTRQTEAIEAHLPTLQAATAIRSERQNSILGKIEQLSEPTIRNIARQAPAAYRPLLEALLAEIQSLVSTTRKQMQGNQMLLRRSLMINRELSNAIVPGNKRLATYGRKGALRAGQSLAGRQYVTQT